eukprot:3819629-Amphidinium_carterae.9
MVSATANCFKLMGIGAAPGIKVRRGADVPEIAAMQQVCHNCLATKMRRSRQSSMSSVEKT